MRVTGGRPASTASRIVAASKKVRTARTRGIRVADARVELTRAAIAIEQKYKLETKELATLLIEYGLRVLQAVTS